MQRFDAIDQASLKSDLPDFRAGDTVKVHVKVIEGNRSRVQVFQGVVIGRSGDGVREAAPKFVDHGEVAVGAQALGDGAAEALGAAGDDGAAAAPNADGAAVVPNALLTCSRTYSRRSSSSFSYGLP